ncbi:hypothetical protein MRX96_020392 [Rhipicephalus microplus]
MPALARFLAMRCWQRLNGPLQVRRGSSSSVERGTGIRKRYWIRAALLRGTLAGSPSTTLRATCGTNSRRDVRLPPTEEVSPRVVPVII